MPTSRRVRVPLSSSNPRKPRKQASKPSAPAVAAGNPKGKEAVVNSPYIPLGPRIDHEGGPLLPWKSLNISIVQIFELFWDKQAVDLLVVGTNTYAAEKEASCQRTAQPGRAAIRQKWKPVGGKEIRVFGRDSILRAMTLKEFSQIKRYLHISDPGETLSQS
ncbi:hypothetical protein C7212DRAFT_314522 [Tuber magnatum]|uniref:PiggyBac transposable element-derived protein domain-containing protein n=1 Tax=Tuber magnatum TaxID=42249 RepID=A0A317SUN4_9PEZI|nr:hypothetical protein C7212DRAFT_314522 [Tuber magnatum]